MSESFGPEVSFKPRAGSLPGRFREEAGCEGVPVTGLDVINAEPQFRDGNLEFVREGNPEDLRVIAAEGRDGARLQETEQRM